MGQKRTKSQKRLIPKWRSELEKWADRAANGELVVSPQVAGAARRFLNWLETGRYEFRVDEVDRALTFFGYLQHLRGRFAGRRFDLAPWQLFVVANLFGWWAEKRRVTRTAFISVARKNGKSTLAAGLALKMLFADSEAGPQVVCVATSRDQARIVFSEAAMMTDTSATLRNMGYVYRSELRCPGNRGRFWAAGADSARLWGYSLSCAIVDELHAHKDRRLWDAVATSMVARQNPLLIAISTAGDDESLLFDEMRSAAQLAVQDDQGVDSFFAFDCYVPDDVDFRDPGIWAAANPSLGITIMPDDLATALAQARTPSAEAAFRRYHLNQQITGAGQWIPVEIWRDSEIPQEPNDYPGADCIVGVDLGSTRDLSSVVAIFDRGENYYMKHWSFTSEFAATKGPRARLYSRFVASGDLAVTPGDSIDEAQVRKCIFDLTKQYKVRAIYYDKALATGVMQRLVSDGVPESVLVAHPMTSRAVDAPIREVETMIYERKIKHLKSELLEYCLANTVVETNQYGLRRLSKRRSTGPIDPIVALVLAAGNARLQSQAEAIGIQWL